MSRNFIWFVEILVLLAIVVIFVSGARSQQPIGAVGVIEVNRTFADGAVGTPSVSFTNDVDTGIWRSADGSISLSGNGEELVRINQTAFNLLYSPLYIDSVPIIDIDTTNSVDKLGWAAGANASNCTGSVFAGKTNGWYASRVSVVSSLGQSAVVNATNIYSSIVIGTNNQKNAQNNSSVITIGVNNSSLMNDCSGGISIGHSGTQSLANSSGFTAVGHGNLLSATRASNVSIFGNLAAYYMNSVNTVGVGLGAAKRLVADSAIIVGINQEVADATVANELRIGFSNTTNPFIRGNAQQDYIKFNVGDMLVGGAADALSGKSLVVEQGLGNAVADGWDVYSLRELKDNIVSDELPTKTITSIPVKKFTYRIPSPPKYESKSFDPILSVTGEVLVTRDEQYEDAMAYYQKRVSRAEAKGEQLGFVAEDLPEEVRTERGYDLAKMVAYQAKVINQLIDRIEALEAK